MDYEKLIQQVYQRISLWNAKDSNYHNREYKAKLWSEVAENLNTTRKYLLIKDILTIRYILFVKHFINVTITLLSIKL